MIKRSLSRVDGRVTCRTDGNLERRSDPPITESDPRLLRLFAWSGICLLAVWLIALIVFGKYIPPQAPSDSAVAIAHWYAGHTTGIRIAMVLMEASAPLYAVWAVLICVLIRQSERGLPVLTYAGIALAGGSMVIFVLCSIFWGVAAFRPDTIAPEITRALNDLGWFVFSFDGSPFILFNLVIAAAAVRDRSEPRVFPRWVAPTCLIDALLFIPCQFLILTKTGPFASNGVLGLYVPAIAYASFVVMMSAASLDAIGRTELRRA